jgi:HEAT repeat protein
VNALQAKDFQVQVEAAEALGKIGDIRAVEPLVATLQDMDGWVRAAAA